MPSSLSRFSQLLMKMENSTQIMKLIEQNPVLVDVTRGNGVESRHRGAIAIINGAGNIIEQCSNIDAPVLPRSAIKSIQALALIETGAADHFEINEQELAIACASHSSGPEHLAVVEGWLKRLGLSADDLECGSMGSIEKVINEELIRKEDKLTRSHNNCSGKHAGFLTTALHMGEPTKGYISAGHPVQARILKVLEEMADTDLSQAHRGCDGCGIPVIALPLGAMARCFAKMASPDTLPKERGAAVQRITAAIGAQPIMIAGHRRFDTIITQATQNGPNGQALVKTGAEGVYGAILPGLGLGVALKIDDGATRASEVAMAAALRHLGIFNKSLLDSLKDLLEPVVATAMGEPCGVVRATPFLDGMAR
jgi:L-asparaginase II